MIKNSRKKLRDFVFEHLLLRSEIFNTGKEVHNSLASQGLYA